ncbi:molybdopterin dinucleotide binding domain protein, partial [Vibrio parahaemolyticus V-223/04]
RTGSAINSNP